MTLRRTAAAFCSAAATITLLGGIVPQSATAAPAAAPAGSTLSVFAWNVDLGTAVVDWSQNEKASTRTPVIESIVRQHSADVVILDELFNNSSISDINSKLADLYPYRTPVVAAPAPAAAGPGPAATAPAPRS